MESIPSDKIKIGANYLHSYYTSKSYFNSKIYNFSASFPISTRKNLIIKIPYLENKISYSKFCYCCCQKNKKYSGIGNIFIGYQSISNRDLNSALTLGLFLPTKDEDYIFNIFTDYYNYPYYLHDYFSIYANYAKHKFITEAFRFGYEVGPTISFNSEDDGTEFSLHYGIEISAYIKDFILNLEVVGQGFLTNGNYDNFFERFINMLNFGVLLDHDFFTPKIYYKIFLKDDVRKMLDGVLGVGVSFNIKT